VIGDDVVIGDDSCLYPRVVVYPKCFLGKRVVVHAGVVIGADGFGIAREDGRWVKIPQIGGVRIGDDVEIGANSTIDRGALDDTVIEEGVKLDNQVQVGHNVRIGAHSAVAGCVGIAGSADIGRHCTIGGAAMIHGHITIVDHVHVSAGTLISRSLLKPGTYTGFYPFDEHEAWKRNAVQLRRLGKIKSRGKKDG
jgi:UDP-3-O-[3-hydroxymyristoyl] glucosamine N-acyltransferase